MKVFVNGVLPKGKWRWSSWGEGDYTITDGFSRSVIIRTRDGGHRGMIAAPVDSDSMGYWTRIDIKGYYEKV